MKRIMMGLLVIGLVWAICPPLVTLAQEAEKQEYVVKKGDTPSDIFYVLWNFYQIKPDQVIEWNPELGLRRIYPGQKIVYYLSVQSVQNQTKEQLDEIKSALRQISANQTASRLADQATKEGNQEILAQMKEFENYFQSQQKTNQLIREGNQEILAQMKEFENYFQSQQKETRGISETLIPYFWVIAVILVVILAFLIFGQEEAQEVAPQVEFTIGGQKYTYRPKIDKDGRYISIYKKGKDILAFKSIIDLRKSVISTLKKEPDLIEEEIKAGRLKKL